MPFRKTSRLRPLAFLVALALVLGAGFASAETEEELLAKRAHWQDRYRTLLQNRVILKDNIAKLRNDYAQAQRRNYPRGGARDAFLQKAEEQEDKLAEVERELDSIQRDARAAGVPPGWLAEVEDESFEIPQPAAPSNDGDEVDREGRNPIYFEEDENE